MWPWGGVISEDRLSIARDSVRSHNLTRGLAQPNRLTPLALQTHTQQAQKTPWLRSTHFFLSKAN